MLAREAPVFDDSTRPRLDSPSSVIEVPVVHATRENVSAYGISSASTCPKEASGSTSMRVRVSTRSWNPAARGHVAPLPARPRSIRHGAHREFCGSREALGSQVHAAEMDARDVYKIDVRGKTGKTLRVAL